MLSCRVSAIDKKFDVGELYIMSNSDALIFGFNHAEFNLLSVDGGSALFT